MSVVGTCDATGRVDLRSIGLVWGLGLGGYSLEAPMFDSLSLDPFTLFGDGLGSAEGGGGLALAPRICRALLSYLIAASRSQSLISASWLAAAFKRAT